MRRSLFLPLVFTAGTLLAAGLAGCKAEVEAELDVSSIRQVDAAGLFVTSRVTAGDCDRGVGSAEREGTLGWTNWLLSAVFPDTRFRSCRERDGGGVATFLNMIVFDPRPEAAVRGRSHVNLRLEHRVLSVVLPDYVQGNIRRVQQQAGADTLPEISAHLELVNNDEAPFGYRVAQYDALGHAGWSEPRELPAASRVRIDFPAALARQVLSEGRAPALKVVVTDR